MIKKFKFSVASWKEGKYYIAQSLNVDVSSFGKTRKKALDNLEEALDLYIDEGVMPIRKFESLRAQVLTISSWITENGYTEAHEERILKAGKEAMRGKNVVVTNNWKETKAYLDKLKSINSVTEIPVGATTQSKMDRIVKKWSNKKKK